MHVLTALRFISVASTCLWRYGLFHSPAQLAFRLGYSIINVYLISTYIWVMTHEHPKNAVFHVWDLEINCPIRILMPSAGSPGFLASLFLYSVLHVYLLAYGLWYIRLLQFIGFSPFYDEFLGIGIFIAMLELSSALLHPTSFFGKLRYIHYLISSVVARLLLRECVYEKQRGGKPRVKEYVPLSSCLEYYHKL